MQMTSKTRFQLMGDDMMSTLRTDWQKSAIATVIIFVGLMVTSFWTSAKNI